MGKREKTKSASAAPYRVVRVFDGDRTAERIVADLVTVHNAS